MFWQVSSGQDWVGDARIFAVGAGAFVAAGAVVGVGLFEVGVDGDEGIAVGRAVLHVDLEAEPLREEMLDHVLERILVELGRAFGAVSGGIMGDLGDQVVAVFVHHLGGSGDHLVADAPA